MELFIEFIEFAFTFILWIVFWTVVLEIAARFWINRQNPEEKEELVEKILSMLHRIKQEKHGEVYYWYDADSDAFLAQGTNDDEIKNHLKERFKGHVFILDEERAWAGPELQVVKLAELKMKDKSTIA